MAKAVLTLAIAGGAVFSAATPASARDLCAGAYEVDGCEYCSYGGSMQSYHASYCDWGFSGYYWAQCRTYVNGLCVGGSI